MIAIDAQESAATMVDNYKAWLPDRIRECAEADRAVVSTMLVSGETGSSTVLPQSADLGDVASTGNPRDDEFLVDQKIDEVVRSSSAIFDAPEQQDCTDIIGAVCGASHLLEGHSPKNLIFFTDAVNNRKPYELATIALDEKSISNYVEQIKSDGVLCDLEGVRVSFYGVGIGEGTEVVPSTQFVGIEKFWRALFDAAGATVVAYARNP